MTAMQGSLPISIEDNLFKQQVKLKDPMRGVPAAAPARKDAHHRDLLNGSNAEVLRQDGTVAGTVRKIMFADPSRGFHVLKVTLDDGGNSVSFVGASEPVSVGDRVEAKGEWERTAKYGLQLRAKYIRVLAPSTGREIAEFLRSGGIKGIGKRTAEKLETKFGDDLVKAMDKPTLLMSAGITEKQAEAIATAWQERSLHTEIVAFLQSLSLGPATAQKIIKRYGEKTRATVIANPYQPAKDITGIGFKTADHMALAMGLDRTDARRVDAAILHCFQQVQRDGHCAMSRHHVMKNVRSLLTIDDRHIAAGLDRMVADHRIIAQENGGAAVLYEAGMLRCEEEVAERLVARLNSRTTPADIDEMIAHSAKEIGISSLHENQALAVKTSIGSNVSIITGGPGAGKTASLEVLLRVFEMTHPDPIVVLGAPTGRAAQKMSEATGRPAQTIHRMLEWTPEKGGFTYNTDNPIEADILVLDESSMLDIWLMRDVLRAVPESTVLVFVGDVDQLASVGPGQVLRDMINSGIIPVTRLTRVFRQEQGSLISVAATEINSGRVPRLGPPARSTDMWGIFSEDPEVCLEKIGKLAEEIAPQLGFDPMRQVQVIAPGHGGTLGTVSINKMMQDMLNPAKSPADVLEIKEGEFRVGDRVIQLANDYDRDVFNGDIGQVMTVNKSRRGGGHMEVLFDDRVVEYTAGDAKELSLAYAISIHKSQGSEFPFVIFVGSMQHYIMLSRTLFYTAVTRAKKICAFVGQQKALRAAVRNTGSGRQTGLSGRLAIQAAERERRGLL